MRASSTDLAIMVYHHLLAAYPDYHLIARNRFHILRENNPAPVRQIVEGE